MVKQNEKYSLRTKENIILLEPKFPGIDYYEFNKYEAISNIGYDTAKQTKLAESMEITFKRQ